MPDGTWGKRFAEQYDKKSQSNRNRRIRNRKRGPRPPDANRLAEARSRLETRYATARATAEALPYFAQLRAAGRWQFAEFKHWLRFQADAVREPDARLVLRAELAPLQAAARRRVERIPEPPSESQSGPRPIQRYDLEPLGRVQGLSRAMPAQWCASTGWLASG